MDERRADYLRRLAAGPERIAEVARALAIDRNEDPGGEPWSARQNVAHLALAERLVFHERLDQLAADGIPAWSWTEPGTSDAPAFATLDRALAAFAEARAETVARVTPLDDAGWLRFGHHATFGRLDVAGLLDVIVDHDEQHRSDIERLAGRGGAASDAGGVASGAGDASRAGDAGGADGAAR